MTFRKSVLVMHRWLGFLSGLVVFVLGITGCLLAFEVEIRNLTEPFRKVKIEDRPLLPPETLRTIADRHLQFGKALGIEYPGEGKAAVGMYYDLEQYELVFMNPYTGEVLRHKDMTRDFFRIVLDGHYYLWLPHKIGQPIAATATMLFVILMISGIILWWPKSKATRRQRFTIKWNVRWRRKNYDLHNVLGFYMSWVAIFLALTGLVFGFQWVANSIYWVSSGGETRVADAHPHSDTTAALRYPSMANHLWDLHRSQVQSDELLAIYFAATAADPVEVVVNHRPGTYYNSDFYHYDQYSGALLEAEGSYDGKFGEADFEDKLVRMNYDMHVGAILGLPGKLLAFFASLIAASLPVTGVLIWLGRRKKKASPKREAVVSLAGSN